MHEQTRVQHVCSTPHTRTHTQAVAKIHIAPFVFVQQLNMRALCSIDCHFNFIYLTLIRIRYV